MLYLEDFDAPAVKEYQDTSACNEEEATPLASFTEEDIEAARAQGYEEGRQAALAEAIDQKDMRRRKFEQSVIEDLKNTQLLIDESVQAIAEETAAVILIMTSQLFPTLLKNHALNEREVLFKKLIPVLRSVGQMTGTFATGEGAEFQALCKREGLSILECTENAEFSSGDFKIAWGSAHVSRTAHETVKEIQHTLEQFIKKSKNNKDNHHERT